MAGRWAAGILAGLMVMGCTGGGGGNPAPTGHPPALSNLVVAPKALYVGAQGGLATVSATFDFSDAGGDLANLTLVVKNGSDQVLQTLTEAIPGAGGITQGQIYGQLSVSTSTADHYTFQLSVADGRASASNLLSGTFTVAPVPLTARTPMPAPRHRCATATVGGRVYVLGGGDFLGNSFATVEAYDPVTDTWSTRAPMTTPRDTPVAGVINGKIYVAGGELTGAAEVYDPGTDTWSPIAPLPTPRTHPTGGVVGGRLVVAGGSQGLDLDVVEAYDPATGLWSTLASLPTPRAWAACGVLNGRLYVVGGYQGGTMVPWLTRVDIYDPLVDRWSPGPDLPAGTYQHTVMVVGGKLVVAGGIQVTYATDAVWRLDPGTGRWSPGAPLPAPMAQHTAGAAGTLGFLIDGAATWAYDPGLDLGPLY